MTMYVIAFILVVVASHQYEKNQELEKQRQTKKKKKPEGIESIFNQKRKKKHCANIWFYFQKYYKNNRSFSAERVSEREREVPSE